MTPFFVLVPIVIQAVLTGCEIKYGGDNKDRNEKKIAAPVVVQKVERGEISTSMLLNGLVKPIRDVEVFSRLVGNIVEIKFDVGDLVRERQILALLDDAEQELALSRAKTVVKKEETRYDRAVELFNRQMLPEDEFEQLKIALEDAQLNRAQAELSLDYCTIKAPISGNITERLVDVGDKVDPSRPLFKIVDQSELHVDTWIAEKEMAAVTIGNKAEVFLDSNPGIKNQGEVIRINPVVDPNFGKVRVTFRIHNNSNLRPGQYINLRMTLATHSNVLVVPKQSIIYESGSPVVYVFSDSLALRRKVVTGLETVENVEISSGLVPGDSLIVEGQATLRDSAFVKIVQDRL